MSWINSCSQEAGLRVQWQSKQLRVFSHQSLLYKSPDSLCIFLQRLLAPSTESREQRAEGFTLDSSQTLTLLVDARSLGFTGANLLFVSSANIVCKLISSICELRAKAPGTFFLTPLIWQSLFPKRSRFFHRDNNQLRGVPWRTPNLSGS